MTGRLAEWRTATGEGGGPVDLYPLYPPTRPRPVTIRHCCGCCGCCDAYESQLPCDRPGRCSPEHPCLGRVQARQWGERHLAAGCRPVATASQVGRRWQEWEDALLADPDASARDLAMRLGRAPAAVKQRRRQLGVEVARPSRRWEPYEDELLRSCPSLPDAEAMLPDRSRQALICRARHLHHHLTYRRQETAA